MPDPIPPPGPERDRAILFALGYHEGVRRHADHSEVDTSGDAGGGWRRRGDKIETAVGAGVYVAIIAPNGDPRYDLNPDRPWPPYSTDSAFADRLVEEMVRRGWEHRYEHRRDGSRFARFDGLSGWGAHIADGSDRPDAVSAAALSALRGGK